MKFSRTRNHRRALSNLDGHSVRIARRPNEQKSNFQVAWALKERFRQFWDYTYPGVAEKFFVRWFWRATHGRLRRRLRHRSYRWSAPPVALA